MDPIPTIWEGKVEKKAASTCRLPAFVRWKWIRDVVWWLSRGRKGEPTGDEMPGQSFNSLDLYVAKNEKDKVIQKFTDFLEHLKSLKPLREAGFV